MDASITRRAGTDRPNTSRAAVVDLALVIADKLNVQAAAHFLAAYGAGFALTCRVLGDPRWRRAHDLDLSPPVP